MASISIVAPERLAVHPRASGPKAQSSKRLEETHGSCLCKIAQSARVLEELAEQHPPASEALHNDRGKRSHYRCHIGSAGGSEEPQADVGAAHRLRGARTEMIVSYLAQPRESAPVILYERPSWQIPLSSRTFFLRRGRAFSRRQYEYRNDFDYRGSDPTIGGRRLVRQRTLVLTQPALSANTFVTRQDYVRATHYPMQRTAYLADHRS
jgi:hypothetical protein